jgi:hypothetical protein
MTCGEAAGRGNKHRKLWLISVLEGIALVSYCNSTASVTSVLG